MTPIEYVQLKAFARQDGALLALVWAGSFACYVAGISSPSYGFFAILLIVLTPFFVAHRLRNYRDYGREGVISFARAWAFVVLMFFYASLLFALVQYVYFAYLDQGYLIDSLQKMLSTPEAEQMIAQSGMGDAMSQSMNELLTMRPIDLSLNVLTTNILLGMLLGLPLAGAMKRSVSSGNQVGPQL